MQGNDVFCTNLKNWRTNGQMIYESDLAYAILSPTPVKPGHLIIVPRMHVPRIGDLDDKSAKAYLETPDIAFRCLLERYYADNGSPHRLFEFYDMLRRDPPTQLGIEERARDACTLMLAHPMLFVPPIGYFGDGFSRGTQHTVMDHAHGHLYPIRVDESLSEILAKSPDFI